MFQATSFGPMVVTLAAGFLTGAGISRAQVTEKVVHRFHGRANGGRPLAAVVRDPAGNLYGTAVIGGSHRSGVLYMVDTKGTETVLHNFGFHDGGDPQGGLVRDAQGNLYGTTVTGGTKVYGVVYKLDSEGNYTVLHSFDAADGSSPMAHVTLDGSGNLYGTTFLGGTANYGVVFKIDASGNFTVLHSFTGGADGANPSAGLTLDAVGNLYGTTQIGGASGRGVVFQMDTNGNETVLYAFKGAPDAGQPSAGVVLDESGNIYGTTFYGGSVNEGSVYMIDQTGQERVLHSFIDSSDGAFPECDLVRDKAGNLYGTARDSNGLGGQGVVFKIDRRGRETTLHTFGGLGDGREPIGGVIFDPRGNLYGTTTYGGSTNHGIIYKLIGVGAR